MLTLSSYLLNVQHLILLQTWQIFRKPMKLLTSILLSKKYNDLHLLSKSSSNQTRFIKVISAHVCAVTLIQIYYFTTSEENIDSVIIKAQSPAKYNLYINRH